MTQKMSPSEKNHTIWQTKKKMSEGKKQGDTKKFDGEEYIFIRAQILKEAAKTHAENIRNAGFNVRIIKEKTPRSKNVYYALYAREKTNQKRR